MMNLLYFFNYVHMVFYSFRSWVQGAEKIGYQILIPNQTESPHINIDRETSPVL